MNQMNTSCAGCATLRRLRLSVLGLAALAAMPVGAVDLVVTTLSSLESFQDTTSLRLRKLLVPNQGFKSGVFKWDAIKKAWVLQGALKADDTYYGGVQLWKMFDMQPTPQREKLSLYAGGFGVKAISFKAPAGALHSASCSPDGTQFGMNMFGCDEDLPVGQTELGDGKYVVTYTLTSGLKVSRNFYLSGAYPPLENITYPANGATLVPVAPVVKWTAYGATQYDFIIRDTAQNEIYDTSIGNAIDGNLSHTVPAGKLQPGRRYYLTIEAKGPVVNGGSKGLKKAVEFTTAP
jgi:hypothetical protein